MKPGYPAIAPDRSIRREIDYFGQRVVAACDGRCERAFGWNRRRCVQVDPKNRDDFYFVSDAEAGEAPDNPGTYEGGDAKPTKPADLMNRWCVRECERSRMGPIRTRIKLPDFSKRLYNIPEHDPERKYGSDDQVR